MIAMVPMEVPVAKESRQAMMKASIGSMPGLRNCMKMELR